MRFNLSRYITDESGQIFKHVMKIVLVVVVIGILLSEGGPLLFYRFSTMQDAEDIAKSAASEYLMQQKNIPGVLNTIGSQLRTMGYSEEEISQCVIQFLPVESREKTSVRATVVKYANTLFTRNIEPLKKYSRIASTREEELSSSAPSRR
ncbi:MAG: hypothetical protein PHO53_06240 [Actinomycetota bacterium]|nr:hypothetical protein [Actinomycetota bacterium]